ncbi:MAG: hypothetical protein HPY55_06880 [Firmicutes bacterium]|nr:hypothetical protein [Bacillota bacterium]
MYLGVLIVMMVVYVSISILGYVFLHLSESKPFGIARLVFGKDALLPYPWTHIDPLVYSLPLPALVFVIVSMLTAPPEPGHVDRCFEGI